MTTLNDREKAYENKFMRDEELHFKATAAALKAVAAQVAAKLGETDTAAYAKSVVMGALVEGGVEDGIAQLVADAKAKSVTLSQDDLKFDFEKFHTAEMEKLKGAN